MKKSVRQKPSKTKQSSKASAKKSTSKRTESTKIQATEPVQIVGIGASAGGLEALKQFLVNTPADSGLAFVVVQHLDPTRKGLMVELLQSSITLPVTQIKDRMQVEANHVYVIPPNRDLSVLNGKLHLFEPIERRGLRLPIDTFFRSLADDQRENSIAVILSGMGSDGTLGIRAIKGHAGTVFVQSADSAKFGGMPVSAINTGLADVIAPVEELAEKIISFKNHLPLLIANQKPDSDEINLRGLEKIILILRSQTGHDFSSYKKNSLSRRIERRMSFHRFVEISDYVTHLRNNPSEANLLFRELLIGVTSFFRDPDVWEQVKALAIPKLLANHPGGGVLRAWIAGCSTGEEAYSLAIIFQEVLEKANQGAAYSLQIFATDLDENAIAQARRALYPANIAVDVSASRLQQFFVEKDGQYHVNKRIRESVIFAPQNLVMNPPFTKIDFLSCRNLLIYLEQDLQKKLLPLFHYSLNPGGILLLGSAETVGTYTNLFTHMIEKSQLFLRRDIGLPIEKVEFPSGFLGVHTHQTKASTRRRWAAPPEGDPAALTTEELLFHFSSAAVLVTDTGNIVHINGKTGNYLEPAIGKADMNIFAMAREGLSAALNIALVRAVRQKQKVTIKGVSVETNGHTLRVDITAKYLKKPAALKGMLLIIFSNAAEIPTEKAKDKTKDKTKETTGSSDQLSAMEIELQRSHEDLEAIREEMQTSQEELKSSYEELQSTNEELQSTNEELTTSKEEMQSMNEELQTVNNELQVTVDDFVRSRDDMKNLLNSSDVAILFLDNELKVRRFTTRISSIFKLIPSDVGRPFTDLAPDLNYPDLAKDAKLVLKSLQVVENDIPTHDGRYFNVRIIPYTTQDNRVDGVVMTFSDITTNKVLESSLQESLAVLQARLHQRTGELDDAKHLEKALRKIEAALNKQVRSQKQEIKTGQDKLQIERNKE